jgi:hypothetical protein
MKIAEQIRRAIQKQPEDKVFGYNDLGVAKHDYQTAAKALERLQKQGVIKKMSKGLFYKPLSTPFGQLMPSEEEQLKPYLFKKEKRIAYITGEFLYNKIHLTTQVSFKLKIASSRRINIDKGAIKASSVKSYVEVSDANYELLGYLDALKDIKRIPDCSITQAVKIMRGKIGKLREKNVDQLVKYALQYPPRVRALLGALLEYNRSNVSIKQLKNSLNPLTTFKLGLKVSDLPKMHDWYIE